MNNHGSKLGRMRFFLVSISILLLIIAAVLVVHNFITDNRSDTESRVELPIEVKHRVLFISSYTPTYFSYEEQAKGLESELYPNGIEYDAFYMDTKNYGREKDIEDFYSFLSTRLSAGMQYDALILGDDDALLFALKYKDELFPELPAVFFGINDVSLAEEAAGRPDMTGFVEQNFLEPTMDSAVALLPEATKVVAIHDETRAGSADAKGFFALEKAYPELTFLEINTAEMTYEDFVKALEALDSDTIPIYMTCYSDASKRNYSMTSRTATIVEHTHIPVFRNYYGGEEQGILGGTSLDFEEQGRLVGKTVAAVLSGQEVSEIPLVTDSPGETIYNYEVLQQYSLNPSVLPEDTVFINKPETFFERYGRILPTIILIAGALLLLVLSSNLAVAESRRQTAALEESQKEMLYELEHDSFLDILNRRTVTGRIARAVSKDSVYTILMVDIDDFKGVNESYGHDLADRILLDLTNGLKKMAEEKHWLLGRYGGDQFVLLVPEKRLSEKDPEVTSILEFFRMPIPVESEIILLSASIGIATSDGELSPEQQIINSEIAMFEAKKRGSNTAFLYADEMKRKVREENKIKAKILDAFDNDGFYMVYQPQIDSETLQVSGYEALVRMKEPGIYPGQFIPIIESSGWIARLGRITTELAIKQLASWRDNGYELHPVSVNFSSNQLNDSGYFDFVKDLLINYEIPAKYLEIEIIEGLFIERTAHAEELFRRFKELGIRLLMDDFGTGYSSLGYLTYIPVDVIKLDKSLVDTYLVDGKDAFIRDVINLVHDLDKEVIIEGVEEEWQFKRLCEFSADTIQGYYFSKPIPAEEAIEFRLKPDENSSSSAP